jgi:hypothetical protein
LQRVICDFGSDHAFGAVNKKLREHYEITVPLSAPRSITERHAQEITKIGDIFDLTTCQTTDIVIGECDGSMIPIVETSVSDKTTSNHKSTDRRKNKRLFWKEARLSLAHAKG